LLPFLRLLGPEVDELRKLIECLHLFDLLIFSLLDVAGDLLERLLKALIVLYPVVDRGEALQLGLGVLEQVLKHGSVRCGLVILLLEVCVPHSKVCLDPTHFGISLLQLFLELLLHLSDYPLLVIDRSLNDLMVVSQDLVDFHEHDFEEVVSD